MKTRKLKIDMSGPETGFEYGKLPLTPKMMAVIADRLPLLLPPPDRHHKGKRGTENMVLRFERGSPTPISPIQNPQKGISRWSLTSPGGRSWFVKVFWGINDRHGLLEKKMQLDRVINRSKRTGNKLHLFSAPILIPKPTRAEKAKFSHGIMDLPHQKWWMVVEIQRLVRGSLTLAKFFDFVTGLNPQEADNVASGVAVELAEMIARRVHLPPEQTDLHTNGDLGKDPEYIRAGNYAAALDDIVGRMLLYMPDTGPLHAVVSRSDRQRLHRAVMFLKKEWYRQIPDRGSRLTLVHGDLNTSNILILPFRRNKESRPKIKLIDFSPRVHIGEPLWDTGRLVADLLQVYIEKKDSGVRRFIDVFIGASEEFAGDTFFRQGLCWGIFSMTLLKLYRLGRPILDERVAREFLDHSLRILEGGQFTW